MSHRCVCGYPGKDARDLDEHIEACRDDDQRHGER